MQPKCRSGRSRPPAARRRSCSAKATTRRSRPAATRVAFVRDRRIWIAPIDGSKPAEQAFFARGASESPAWSPDGRRSRSCPTAATTASSALHRRGAADPLSRAVDVARFGAGVVAGRAARSRSCVSPARGGTPRSPLVAAAGAVGDLVVGVEPTDRERRQCTAREVVEERRRARSIRILRIAEASVCAGRPTITLVFLSYQDGWPHLYSLQHPGEGGKPTAADAGRVHGRARRRSRPIGRFLVYNANTGPDRARRRSAPPVQGAGGRPATPTPLTTRHRHRVEPGRHRRRPDGRVLCSRRAAAAAARRRAARPAASARDDRGRSRAGGLSRGAARHAGAGDVPRERRRRGPRPAVQDRPAATATQPGAGLRPRRPPRQMLLGWHYMDYYANDYAREPVPRQPRLHRAVGQLPPRHRLRPRVSVSGTRRRARRVRVPRRARRRDSYLQSAADVDRDAHRHLGRLVRRLPDGAGARPQLRRLRRRRGHPRRPRLGSPGTRRTEPAHGAWSATASPRPT